MPGFREYTHIETVQQLKEIDDRTRPCCVSERLSYNPLVVVQLELYKSEMTPCEKSPCFHTNENKLRFVKKKESTHVDLPVILIYFFMLQ